MGIKIFPQVCHRSEVKEKAESLQTPSTVTVYSLGSSAGWVALSKG